MEILRERNRAQYILFPLVDPNTGDLVTGLSFASGDVTIQTSGSTTPVGNSTNLPEEITGSGMYRLVLTATELDVDTVISVKISDQTVPKAWQDQVVLIQPFGVGFRGTNDTGLFTLMSDATQSFFDATNSVFYDATKLGVASNTMVTGLAVTGTLSTTQMSTDLTETTNDHYKDRSVIWTSGTLQNQARRITAYNGTTKVLTFDAATEAPLNNDAFIIV